jgi:hypothetical protein
MVCWLRKVEFWLEDSTVVDPTLLSLAKGVWLDASALGNNCDRNPGNLGGVASVVEVVAHGHPSAVAWPVSLAGVQSFQC